MLQGGNFVYNIQVAVEGKNVVEVESNRRQSRSEGSGRGFSTGLKVFKAPESHTGLAGMMLGHLCHPAPPAGGALMLPSVSQIRCLCHFCHSPPPF